MITIEKIKEVLFSEEVDVANFIVETDDIQPPIPGNNFDEKLYNLLHGDNDRAIQILLAPYLRKRVFTCFDKGQTSFARETKTTYIERTGHEVFNELTTGIHSTEIEPATYREIQDFNALQQYFISERGREIWLDHIASDQQRKEHALDPFFTDLKAQFLQKLPQESWITSDTTTPASAQQTWERACYATDRVLDFDIQKLQYIHTWGEKQWQRCLAHEQNFHSPTPANTAENLDVTSAEEYLEFPLAPNADEEFSTFKNIYLKKYGIDSWRHALSIPPLSAQAITLSCGVKNRCIQHFGLQQWLRIFRPEAAIEAFDLFKNSFIHKRGRDVWEKCFTNTGVETLSPEILIDFTERKYQYLNKIANSTEINEAFRQALIETHATYNAQNLIPIFQRIVTTLYGLETWENYTVQAQQSWEQAQSFPVIPPKSQDLIDKLRNRFINTHGTQRWQAYLQAHKQNAEYATDAQLKILGQLFDFNIQITDINPERTNTYIIPTETSNAPLIEFYYTTSHYYIHEGGYSETVGNGNCGYNGFAQWLQLLLLNRKPRRLIVRADPGDFDNSSFVLVQRALYLGLKNETSSSSGLVHISDDIKEEQISQLVRLDDEISINSIRKELDLPFSNATAKELGSFIKTKTNALTHIIRAKKLPFSNRLPLLKTIGHIATLLSEDAERQADLIKLQTILLFLTNTTYLPHTPGVHKDWTKESYDHNLASLKAVATNELPAEIFQNLGAEITSTNFQSCTLESLTTYTTSPAFSRAIYDKQRADEDNEDWLSASLCIAGIFMLITSLTFLASLILISLTGGLVHLGLLLMEIGLTSVAVSLGSVIGLSAPYTATLIATGASCMVAGLGFTLFKDFAPQQSIGSISSLMPNSSIF